MWKFVLWMVILDGDGFGRGSAMREFEKAYECAEVASGLNHAIDREANEVWFCQVELIV